MTNRTMSRPVITAPPGAGSQGPTPAQDPTGSPAVAVAELGIDAEVVKVEDLQVIMAYGVMSTPALVVDGQVRLAGHIATLRRIRELLEAAP